MGVNEDRIRNVNAKINDELNNIASHLGVTKNYLVKKHCQEIISKYPDKFKSPITDERMLERTSQFAVRGLSDKTRSEVKNIATNIGLDKNEFWKLILFEIRESYPEHKRKPFNSEI